MVLALRTEPSAEQEVTLEEANAFCESLSEADDLATRELLTRIADKWSLWVLHVLADAGGPLRFSRVGEQVEGISQKSLTKTLRQLERDGLATRQMFLEVPPRVEYTITPLGIELLRQVFPLWFWIARNMVSFHAARSRFDAIPRPTATDDSR
jgi:DNA-binding HxlR family transcriptional regulator